MIRVRECSQYVVVRVTRDEIMRKQIRRMQGMHKLDVLKSRQEKKKRKYRRYKSQMATSEIYGAMGYPMGKTGSRQMENSL